MEENNLKIRYKNTKDTFTITELDESPENLERQALGEVTFVEIIKTLETDRDRFIALALYQGYSKVDIAYMSSVNPSQITRATQKMQVKLTTFKKPSGSRI